MRGRWPEGLDSSLEKGPQRYGDRAARMRRVDPRDTLRSVLLQEGHVIPGRAGSGGEGQGRAPLRAGWGAGW